MNTRLFRGSFDGRATCPQLAQLAHNYFVFLRVIPSIQMQNNPLRYQCAQAQQTLFLNQLNESKS